MTTHSEMHIHGDDVPQYEAVREASSSSVIWRLKVGEEDVEIKREHFLGVTKYLQEGFTKEKWYEYFVERVLINAMARINQLRQTKEGNDVETGGEYDDIGDDLLAQSIEAGLAIYIRDSLGTQLLNDTGIIEKIDLLLKSYVENDVEKLNQTAKLWEGSLAAMLISQAVNIDKNLHNTFDRIKADVNRELHDQDYMKRLRERHEHVRVEASG